MARNEGDRLHEGRLEEQLQRLIQAIEANEGAILPRSNDALLQSIVEAAARIFGAAAASITLLDEQAQVLECKVMHGAGKAVVGRQLPWDQSIAGYVAMTGQPIAISNVQQERLFDQDFAQSSGYTPRSILATPLLSGDRVIGVMEVLDKLDSVSFGMRDMELLGIFAQQAAVAIHQSQQVEQLNEALLAGLKQILAGGPEARSGEMFSALDADAQDEAPAQDILPLAGQFFAISELGEAERKVCLQILSTFGEYARLKLDYSNG